MEESAGACLLLVGRRERRSSEPLAEQLPNTSSLRSYCWLPEPQLLLPAGAGASLNTAEALQGIVQADSLSKRSFRQENKRREVSEQG